MSHRRERWSIAIRICLEILRNDGLQGLIKKALFKLNRGRRLKGPFVIEPDSVPDLNDQYAAFLRRHVLWPDGIATIMAVIRQLTYAPRISVIIAVHHAEARWIRQAIESVLHQFYPYWELCLASYGLDDELRRLIEEYAAKDSRIHIGILDENIGVVHACNAGVESATGEFIAFLEPHDELAPDALYEIVSELNRRHDLDLLYSDHDEMGVDGVRVNPVFKPDWSPDLLLSMNYVAHLTVFRKSTIRDIGGFRTGFEGNEGYDLLLRLTEHSTRIKHIEKILYHARKSSASLFPADAGLCAKSGCKAIEEALTRRGADGSVMMMDGGRYRVRYAIRGNPLISMIIPTRDKVEFLQACLSSIESKSTYRRYEVVIVDNQSVKPETRHYLSTLAKDHQVLHYAQPFNYAAINNAAAAHALGSHLLFLNNDVQVIEAEWLEALLEHAQRSEVGVVGAKLLFPDNRIQHAGVIVGMRGIASHAFKHLPAESPGYCGLAQVIRNTSAVTGACMMVRRTVFEELGGFDERLQFAFNDIDFCLRARERGYLVVYTPYAVLSHYEGATRGILHLRADEQHMRRRWGKLIDRGDPYYNPNLSREHEDFRLRL